MSNERFVEVPEIKAIRRPILTSEDINIVFVTRRLRPKKACELKWYEHLLNGLKWQFGIK